MYLWSLIVLLTQCIITHQLNLNQFKSSKSLELFVCHSISQDTFDFHNSVLEVPLCIIPTLAQCMESIRLKSYTPNQMKFQKVFYIFPDNAMGFDSILHQIQETMLEQTSKRRMQHHPIYIINYPVPLNEVKIQDFKLKLTRIANSSYCFPLTSLVFISFTHESSNSLHFLEIYCLNRYAVWLLDAGFVFPKGGTFDLERVTSIGRRRYNLQGININVIGRTSPVNQEESKTVVVNGTKRFVSGLTVSILWDLQRLLNFTVTAMESSEFIRQGPNGTITGIGKEVSEGRADLSIAMANLLPYRILWLDFLQSIMPDRLNTFYIQPQDHSRNLLANQFSRELWITIALTWVAIVLSAIFVLRFSSITEYVTAKTPAISVEVIFWALCAVSQQGSFQKPRTPSMKIIFLTGFLTALVIAMAYSASIVSVLNSKEEKPIKKFQDLISNNYRLLGNPSTPYFQELLTDQKKAKDLEIQSLADFKSTNESITTLFSQNPRIPNPGVTEVLNEFYYAARSLNYTEKTLCKVERFMAAKTSSRVSMYLKKGSPYKELFNLKTIMLLENGLVSRYKSKYYFNILPTCMMDTTPKTQHLGIYDTRLAYEIFMVGFVISWISFLVEIKNVVLTKLCYLYCHFIH